VKESKSYLAQIFAGTIYDEASEVTPEMWKNLKVRAHSAYRRKGILNITEQQIKDTMAKFKKANEPVFAFLHPDVISFIEENTKMPTLTDQEKRFVTAGGVIPSVPPAKPLDNGQHYNIVLRHDNPNTWVSADGRETSIAVMVDQHLINTMRFLIRNFQPIREQYLKNIERLTKIAEVDYANNLVVMLNNEEKRVRGMKSSAVFFTAVIAPFETLAEEVVRRFGQRALRAIYDGE
jgi:hypothetical protein